MMVPAGVVDKVLDELAAHLQAGDIVIDGGNSYYRDDIRRAAKLADAGLHHVDVGTSGGVAGVDRGYCLMIGGEAEDRRAPRADLSRRSRRASMPRRGRPGAAARSTSVEQGFLHCGPHGAGHFVKMIHNGIEYGIMAAYAEGLNILRHANVGKQTFANDAETTPLRDPAVLPVRDESAADRRGLAPRQRDRLLAARPDGRSTAERTRSSKATADASPTRAKAAGPFWPPSTKRFRRRSSARLCTNASRRAARRNSPTSCSRRCGTNSAATSKRPLRRRNESVDTRSSRRARRPPTRSSSSASPATSPARRSCPRFTRW